jgi:flavin-dependent dehydrogenase
VGGAPPVHYAIANARLAAKAIARARLSLAGDLSAYEDAIWRTVGHSLATADLTARLFHRKPRCCFELGIGNPDTLRHFVDLVSGRTSYQGIARRLALLTAGWLLIGRQGVSSA